MSAELMVECQLLRPRVENPLKTHRKNNIVGIDDHELTGLDVVTGSTLFHTQKGPVIGIFHEYARCGKG